MSCWQPSLPGKTKQQGPPKLFCFWAAILFLGACCLPPLCPAQVGDNALSEGEIDKLRDTAPLYDDRINLFTAFLDRRARQVVDLAGGRRHAGREEDIQELIGQFTSIAEDLEDNLDDYGKRHRDVRRSLPKLLASIDRWETSLRTPPDHPAYALSRKLALETTADLRKDVAQMIEDQKAWFLAHPPEKEDQKKPERRG